MFFQIFSMVVGNGLFRVLSCKLVFIRVFCILRLISIKQKYLLRLNLKLVVFSDQKVFIYNFLVSFSNEIW